MYIPVAGSVIIESYSKLSMVTTLSKFFKAQPRSLYITTQARPDAHCSAGDHLVNAWKESRICSSSFTSKAE